MLNRNFYVFFFEKFNLKIPLKTVLCRENMRFAEVFVNFVKIFSCKNYFRLWVSLRIILLKKKTYFKDFCKNY